MVLLAVPDRDERGRRCCCASGSNGVGRGRHMMADSGSGAGRGPGDQRRVTGRRRQDRRRATSSVYYGAKQALKHVDLDIRPRAGDGADRPVRLRQVDLPALPQPDERHDRRLPRRPARSRSTARTSTTASIDVGAAARPRRHGVPEAEPVPEVDLRQRRLRPAHPRPRQPARRSWTRSCRRAWSGPACGTR